MPRVARNYQGLMNPGVIRNAVKSLTKYKHGSEVEEKPQKRHKNRGGRKRGDLMFLAEKKLKMLIPSRATGRKLLFLIFRGIQRVLQNFNEFSCGLAPPWEVRQKARGSVTRHVAVPNTSSSRVS